MSAQSLQHILQRTVVTCSPDSSILNATRLMVRNHCSAIVVVEKGCPVGIWTEGDLLKVDISAPQELELPISRLMTRSLLTFSVDLSLDEAAVVLKRQSIRHLIVVDDDGRLFGIVSQSDIAIHQDASYFLSMTAVSAILSSQVVRLVDQSTQLTQVIKIMHQDRLDAIVISSNDMPIGLITERDVVRLIASGQADVEAVEVMSSPLLSVPDSMSLLSVRSFMEKRHIRHLGVQSKEGTFAGLISFSDILQRIEQSYINRLRSALAQSNQNLQQHERSLHLAHALIEATEDGIMVTDEHAIIQSVNPAFSILTGYSEEEVLGRPASTISSGKHSVQFYKDMWQVINRNGRWQGEIWNRRKNGEIYPEWLTVTQIKEPDSNRVLYAGIFNDISERKESEVMIESLAYFDPLTSLPNRQLLMNRLDAAIKDVVEPQQLAVLFIDLDHFKRINDSLGHTFGDEVLCQVSERLGACVDKEDTLARIGGDELVLMLPMVKEPTVVYRKAQMLIESLQAPLTVGARELFVTASIGCAIYPQDGATREALLKNADTAMYRAKGDGRNRVSMYSSYMNEQSQVQLALENKLRNALTNNEFYLMYQPKIDAVTEKVVGVEALLRWHQPELGNIPPDQFIGLTEELGLIDKIGSWVLKTAMEQGVAWVEQGHEPLTISVNVSNKQFIHQDMSHQINQLLELTGFSAVNLDIEVTESYFINNPVQVNRDLAKIRALGATISMDDFGTGYSSLSMLNQMPLDNLKIDRSFIQGIPGHCSSETLVSTIILMAKNLGLSVVAEGVEELSQLDFLRSLGCDQIQGYFFSKPLMPDELISFIQK